MEKILTSRLSYFLIIVFLFSFLCYGHSFLLSEFISTHPSYLLWIFSHSLSMLISLVSTSAEVVCSLCRSHSLSARTTRKSEGGGRFSFLLIAKGEIDSMSQTQRPIQLPFSFFLLFTDCDFEFGKGLSGNKASLCLSALTEKPYADLGFGVISSLSECNALSPSWWCILSLKKEK